eukprot:CAMPEP_0114133580 /NCGR_PEP_ID=MMETSP0043_2-20121206/13706_1 /TAXON_ID=464988 /ORGANISM="Hemiselmis andersenii, Strain CCMP644" /LENGTH=194 /DNA_ID=CAMNT_0001227175 /DNA_START=292 /DNA_END=872 /DNA_ORIENTATION=+
MALTTRRSHASSTEFRVRENQELSLRARCREHRNSTSWASSGLTCAGVPAQSAMSEMSSSSRSVGIAGGRGTDTGEPCGLRRREGGERQDTAMSDSTPTVAPSGASALLPMSGDEDLGRAPALHGCTSAAAPGTGTERLAWISPATTALWVRLTFSVDAFLSSPLSEFGGITPYTAPPRPAEVETLTPPCHKNA